MKCAGPAPVWSHHRRKGPSVNAYLAYARELMAFASESSSCSSRILGATISIPHFNQVAPCCAHKYLRSSLYFATVDSSKESSLWPACTNSCTRE